MEHLILTLDTLGTLLIAWAALRVHHRVLHDHKIDKNVFRTVRIEQKLGFLGMFLVLAAFVLNILQ